MKDLDGEQVLALFWTVIDAYQMLSPRSGIRTTSIPPRTSATTMPLTWYVAEHLRPFFQLTLVDSPSLLHQAVTMSASRTSSRATEIPAASTMWTTRVFPLFRNGQFSSSPASDLETKARYRCHKLTLSSRETSAQRFLEHLRTFVTSIESYVRGATEVTPEDREALRELWESEKDFGDIAYDSDEDRGSSASPDPFSYFLNKNRNSLMPMSDDPMMGEDSGRGADVGIKARLTKV